MSLTPSKYDMNDVSFEGFPGPDMSTVIDIATVIILDLPPVTDSQEKLHFFVASRTT